MNFRLHTYIPSFSGLYTEQPHTDPTWLPSETQHEEDDQTIFINSTDHASVIEVDHALIMHTVLPDDNVDASAIASHRYASLPKIGHLF